jgi:hypothetical protein
VRGICSEPISNKKDSLLFWIITLKKAKSKYNLTSKKKYEEKKWA